ncbi:MAG: type II secretion system protein GspG [Desulfobacterales bacterium]|nr:MAG: type II secretion system protein GspG [Desulfobacterales bacterium]
MNQEKSAAPEKQDVNVPRRRNQGFTLIELMVVVVILGILAAFIVPNIMTAPDDAKRAKAKVEIEALKTALKMYKLDNGAYPGTEQGLQALVEIPSPPPKNWRKGGYLEKMASDPWGNEYVYLCPGQNGDFDIISYGADGLPEGDSADADIRSWEIE